MPVRVCFMKPGWAGAVGTLAYGSCRAAETLAVPATGALTAQQGETVLLVNTEAVAVNMAHGTTPDASLSAATVASTAGYGVPPGVHPVEVKVGDKFDLKAFS